MSSYRVGICILTGGKSTRMGQDKMQISYNGKKLYEEAAERLNKGERLLTVFLVIEGHLAYGMGYECALSLTSFIIGQEKDCLP